LLRPFETNIDQESAKIISVAYRGITRMHTMIVCIRVTPECPLQAIEILQCKIPSGDCKGLCPGPHWGSLQRSPDPRRGAPITFKYFATTIVRRTTCRLSVACASQVHMTLYSYNKIPVRFEVLGVAAWLQAASTTVTLCGRPYNSIQQLWCLRYVAVAQACPKQSVLRITHSHFVCLFVGRVCFIWACNSSAISRKT